jgi:hypothetical protein
MVAAQEKVVETENQDATVLGVGGTEAQRCLSPKMHHTGERAYRNNCQVTLFSVLVDYDSQEQITSWAR